MNSTNYSQREPFMMENNTSLQTSIGSARKARAKKQESYITNFPEQALEVPANHVLRRRFLGVVYTSRYNSEGNLIPELELKFEKAHLKAYLQGRNWFYFGKDDEGNPQSFTVRSEFYFEPIEVK
jgi:hypothetical protein